MDYQILETIRQTARERKVLRIIYIEKDNTSEGWRYVEPYSFSKDEGEQGLFAWDISRAGIRRFSLERITQAEITGQTYTPRYPVEIF
jgi:predicted DNA-binding transcriptional regulator YafY